MWWWRRQALPLSGNSTQLLWGCGRRWFGVTSPLFAIVPWCVFGWGSSRITPPFSVTTLWWKFLWRRFLSSAPWRGFRWCWWRVMPLLSPTLSSWGFKWRLPFPSQREFRWRRYLPPRQTFRWWRSLPPRQRFRWWRFLPLRSWRSRETPPLSATSLWWGRRSRRVALLLSSTLLWWPPGWWWWRWWRGRWQGTVRIFTVSGIALVFGCLLQMTLLLLEWFLGLFLHSNHTHNTITKSIVKHGHHLQTFLRLLISSSFAPSPLLWGSGVSSVWLPQLPPASLSPSSQPPWDHPGLHSRPAGERGGGGKRYMEARVRVRWSREVAGKVG